MFAGQLACEGLNFLLKRIIKEERPKGESRTNLLDSCWVLTAANIQKCLARAMACPRRTHSS